MPEPQPEFEGERRLRQVMSLRDAAAAKGMDYDELVLAVIDKTIDIDELYALRLGTPAQTSQAIQRLVASGKLKQRAFLLDKTMPRIDFNCNVPVTPAVLAWIAARSQPMADAITKAKVATVRFISGEDSARFYVELPAGIPVDNAGEWADVPNPKMGVRGPAKVFDAPAPIELFVEVK